MYKLTTDDVFTLSGRTQEGIVLKENPAINHIYCRFVLVCFDTRNFDNAFHCKFEACVRKGDNRNEL